MAPSSDNEADAVDEVDDERERNSDPENTEEEEEEDAPILVESAPEPATRKRRARKD